MRAGPGRWVGLLVRVALLAVTIWGSNLWLVHIRDSLAAHRSLLVGQPALGEATSPLVQQAVIVLVSGLTYDASLEMPFLNDLREQGLDARCRGYYPSYTQSAWTTIISGASPEINDAPLLDLPYEQLPFLTVDGLFTEAKRANLRTGLAGFHWWEHLVSEAVLDDSFFVTATDAEADSQVVETALAFMSGLPPNLLFIQLSQVSHAASAYGADSQQYRDAVESADSLLRTIAQAVSLSRNVLVVASDHGYLADGGHGGADQEV
ncbi:MAG: alkaline phosphatase family protein, partial [Anaerolineae bacterium]|nr:alkaline phosphatase family protein [Anaerolineae bacterium]